MSTTKDNEDSTSGDAYINKESVIPRGDDDETLDAIVKKRKLDDDGNQLGPNTIIL